MKKRVRSKKKSTKTILEIATEQGKEQDTILESDTILINNHLKLVDTKSYENTPDLNADPSLKKKKRKKRKDTYVFL